MTGVQTCALPICARAEVSIDDVLRFFLGVTSAPVSSRRQRDRFLAMAFAGLAA